MTRETFQNAIKELESDVTEMGAMVAAATRRSVDALKNHAVPVAKQIMAQDEAVNRKRWDIEEKCIEMIARQQPVASDLREIIAILNIITDLERMGDYAEGIAKIVVTLGAEPLVKPLVDIPRMAEKATDMLERSLQAFVRRDAELAKAICNEDDDVDVLYEQVYRELLTFMIEDPKIISRATCLTWVAHNLERIADRVTNICERTVFLVTGTMQDINVSKY
jgi:phosphate transport system protein